MRDRFVKPVMECTNTVVRTYARHPISWNIAIVLKTHYCVSSVRARKCTVHKVWCNITLTSGHCQRMPCWNITHLESIGNMLPDFRYRDSYVGISNALQLKFQKNKYAYYVIVGYSHFFCQHTLFITTHKGFLIHNKENEFLLIFTANICIRR